MATLYLDPIEETPQLLPLIQTAIQNEINRLELAIKIAHKRLIPFEEKYNVTSEKFITDMAAEDLYCISFETYTFSCHSERSEA